MRDDDVMDQLLRDAMSADAPELSPTFDADVLRRVRPRRLTAFGRVALAVYIAAATATTAWFMRELPIETVGVAILICLLVVAGTMAYGRHIIAGQG